MDNHDVSASISDEPFDTLTPDDVTLAPLKTKTQSEVWNYVTRSWKDGKTLSWKCMKCDSTFSMRTSTGFIRNRFLGYGYLLSKVTQKIFGDSWTLVEK